MSSTEQDTGSGGYRIGLPRAQMGLPSVPGGGMRLPPVRMQAAKWPTRVAYLLALAAIVLPLLRVNLAALPTGASAFFGLVWIAFPLLALYRAALVLVNAHTLDAPAVTGWLRGCRIVGIGLAAAASVAMGLQYFAGAYGFAFAMRAGSTGGPQLALSIAAALVATMAPTGLALFEYSRLRAFELAARKATP